MWQPPLLQEPSVILWPVGSSWYKDRGNFGNNWNKSEYSLDSISSVKQSFCYTPTKSPSAHHLLNVWTNNLQSLWLCYFASSPNIDMACFHFVLSPPDVHTSKLWVSLKRQIRSTLEWSSFGKNGYFHKWWFLTKLTMKTHVV